MLRVALTGGIATGKSYVLEQFRRRGVPCLDADELAHGVTAAGTEATAAIAARFGADVLAADGVRRSQRSSARSCSPTVGAPRSRGDRAPGGLSRDRRRPARASSCSAAIRSRSSTSRCCTKPAREKDFDRVIVTACPPETQLARLRRAGTDRGRGAPAPRGAVADGGESRARRLRDPDRRDVRGDHRAGRRGIRARC